MLFLVIEMVEEGELIKRIREHRPVILCDYVALTELGKILDEANKEFPHTNPDGLTVDTIELYKKFIKEYNDWAIRWLGDANE